MARTDYSSDGLRCLVVPPDVPPSTDPPSTDPTRVLTGAPHEQVVRFHDRATGLLGYVAIHSTALGPALGGTRFRPYPDEAAAVADALRSGEGDVVQERARRAPARRRQGGDRRRPGGGEDTRPAAGVRPRPGLARRPVRHRVRLRHDGRGHGRRPRDLPVRHRPLARAGRRRRLERADRVRPLRGDVRGGAGPLGEPTRSPAAWSASAAPARSAPTWSGTCSRTAPRSWSATWTSRRSAGAWPPTRRSGRSPSNDALVARAAGRVRPLLARRRARRRRGRPPHRRRGLRRGEQPAGPPRRRAGCSPTAGSCTPRTSW